MTTEQLNVFTKNVTQYIKDKDMNSLKEFLNNANDADVLEMLEDINSENQAVVYRLLSKERALFVFERLETSSQQKLIKSFTDDAVIEIVQGLDPDDRVELFDEMPAAFTKKMLAELPAEEREMTNLLMGYAPQTAGRIMTPEYVRINRSMSVSQAIQKVKQEAKKKEEIHTIYITNEEKMLEGVISLRELLIADENAVIETIMQKTTSKVSTDTDQEEVAKLLQRLDWYAVPVVDKENRLVGIVTIDDAVDILEEEATEDIFGTAGIAGKEASRSEVLTKGSLLKIWSVRLPFLIITLVAGMAAGLIMEGFEDILESVVIIAFFIPLIMDMGGTVGTQSSTIFARGVVLGHINIKQFFKPFVKEVVVGLSMGALVGLVSGGIITVWLGQPMLGIAVGLSLVATMTLASILGFLVPWVLIKLKADQAAGSAPLITSIKDISGLFIYFGLVSMLLSSYLVDAEYEVTSINITKNGAHFLLDPAEETALLIGTVEGYEYEIPEVLYVLGEEFEVIER